VAGALTLPMIPGLNPPIPCSCFDDMAGQRCSDSPLEDSTAGPVTGRMCRAEQVVSIDRSSTSLRLFLPICLMYYYSLQIKKLYSKQKLKFDILLS
jgi:hypothetical protein